MYGLRFSIYCLGFRGLGRFEPNLGCGVQGFFLSKGFRV